MAGYPSNALPLLAPSRPPHRKQRRHTRLAALNDEMAALSTPVDGQHVLPLALALPHQIVPVVLQQLQHLHARDGAVVPALLPQGLLDLRHQLHGGGHLGGWANKLVKRTRETAHSI